MARKKRIFPGIKKIVEKAAETFVQIEKASTSVQKTIEPKDYEELVRRIVDSIENKKKIDILAYDSLTRRYPQTKNTVDQLIKQAQLLSLYDSEPITINFDYSAYLEQIKILAEIK